jgi:uncharacterized protein (TIRG00374 family)
MSLPIVSDRPSRRSVLVTALIIGASVALLLALVDLRAVAEVVRRSDWRYLAAASAALLAGTGAYALRWNLLLGRRAGWPRTFYAACVGHAVNSLVPLRLGEAARIVVLGRGARLPMGEVTSSVLVERLWEQAMRLSALGAAVAFGAGLRPSPSALAGALAVLAAAAAGIAWILRRQAWLLARVPPALARLPRLEEAGIRHALARLLAGLALATSPRRLAQGALTSVGAWALFWVFHALVLQALPTEFSLAEITTLALATLALAPPSAPTAPGVYHASLVVPLAVVGYSETTLAAYAVVLHALLMGWYVALGLLGVARGGRPALAASPTAAQTGYE